VPKKRAKAMPAVAPERMICFFMNFYKGAKVRVKPERIITMLNVWFCFGVRGCGPGNFPFR
jgi:hypothetical protein